MAGGQGSRLKRLGRFISKASLIVYDQPMLIRHLDHLIEAGFRRILITTNPQHHGAIATLIDAYGEMMAQEGTADLRLRVLNNAAHLTGPTEGFRQALSEVDTPRALLILADEFSLSNPFVPYAKLVDDAEEYGGVSRLLDVRDTLRGGYVLLKDGYIVACEERAGIPNPDGYPSTGLSLFSTRAMLEDCDHFISLHPASASIGDFTDYRVEKMGRRVRAVMDPDFININTQDSLLLANVYAAMERHGPASPLYNEMARMAQHLRQTLRESV
jgi:dTDP-glucose pyrophosphorylase